MWWGYIGLFLLVSRGQTLPGGRVWPRETRFLQGERASGYTMPDPPQISMYATDIWPFMVLKAAICILSECQMQPSDWSVFSQGVSPYRWSLQRERLEQLSMQAVYNVTHHNDEFVKDFLIAHEKVRDQHIVT